MGTQFLSLVAGCVRNGHVFQVTEEVPTESVAESPSRSLVDSPSRSEEGSPSTADSPSREADVETGLDTSPEKGNCFTIDLWYLFESEFRFFKLLSSWSRCRIVGRTADRHSTYFVTLPNFAAHESFRAVLPSESHRRRMSLSEKSDQDSVVSTPRRVRKILTLQVS